MSISLAALGSALASIGSAVGSVAGSSGWLNYSSAKSLNKKTAQQNAAISLASAQQLATNQYGWTVQGLRNAGLNPILAATNLGNTSLPSVNGSVGSTSSPSIENPVTSALQAANVAKQNELLDSQTSNVEANTARTVSEAKLNEAKIRETEQEILNKRNTRGLTGPYAAANQVRQDSTKVVPWLLSGVKRGFHAGNKFADDYFNRPLANLFKRAFSPSSNSAKDYSEGVKKVKKQFGGAFYDSRH